MTALRKEAGQVTVLTAVFIVALMGIAGLVLDVGSWFRQQRVVQTTVDSAALAGAQALPGNPNNAVAWATTFAGKNGGTAGANVSVGSKWKPNDMITVTQTAPSDGFFSKLFGIDTVSLGAKASAVSEVPSQVRYVAPIVVNIKHPDLSGPGCPCFKLPTTLDLGKTGAPGAFALINLDNTDTTGTIGASALSDWIVNGYDKYLPLGGYFSDPGAKWNNNTIQAAMQARYGTDLLFPVYDALVSQGSNAEYHIIGWAGFHLTRAQAGGDSGSLDGYFTEVIWQGMVDESGPPSPEIPDLGVHSVALVD
ncbi:MAG: pilus assembly protein TadG-related protein [Gaiellaceae bacterium]